MESYQGAKSFQLPCGHCIACRIRKASDWAIRCRHEAKCHKANSFLTLTYADEHLPEDGSVSPRAMQLFLKRLRVALSRGGDPGHPVGNHVRFFAVGEYGSQTWRPHYHLLVFGWSPSDKYLVAKSGSGHFLYRSPLLLELWPYGHNYVGQVTAESAGYCARYTLKKVNGDRAVEHYSRPHPVTGIVHQVLPEFARMSRMPGLGDEWYARYKTDAFPSDFVIVDGVKRPVPDYYRRKLKLEDPKASLKLTQQRKVAARLPNRVENSTDARLLVKAEIMRIRAKQLKRTLDDDT